MTRVRKGQARMEVHFGTGPWGKHGRLQWWNANRVPSMIAQAARENGYSSSAHYVRTAILRALERDLGVDFEQMEREQPSKANNKIYANPYAYGAAGSVEDVF